MEVFIAAAVDDANVINIGDRIESGQVIGFIGVGGAVGHTDLQRDIGSAGLLVRREFDGEFGHDRRTAINRQGQRFGDNIQRTVEDRHASAGRRLCAGVQVAQVDVNVGGGRRLDHKAHHSQFVGFAIDSDFAHGIALGIRTNQFTDAVLGKVTITNTNERGIDNIQCIEFTIVGEIGGVEVDIALEGGHALAGLVFSHELDGDDITGLHGRLVGFEPEANHLVAACGGTATRTIKLHQGEEFNQVVVVNVAVAVQIVDLVFGPVGVIGGRAHDGQEGDDIVIVDDSVAVEVATLEVGILDGEGDGCLCERRAGVCSNIHFRKRDGNVIIALDFVVAIGLDDDGTGVLASGDDRFRIHTEVNTGGERVRIGHRDQRAVEGHVSGGGNTIGERVGDDHLVAFGNRVSGGRQGNGRVVVDNGNINHRLVEDEGIIRAGDGVGEVAIAGQEVVFLVHGDCHSRFTSLDGLRADDFAVFDEVNGDIAFESIAEADGQVVFAFFNRRFSGSQSQRRALESGCDDDFAVIDGREQITLEVESGQCDTGIFVRVVKADERDGAAFRDFLEDIEGDGRVSRGRRGGLAVGAAEADTDDLVAFLNPRSDGTILAVVTSQHLRRIRFAVCDVSNLEDRAVEHDAEVTTEQYVVGFEVNVHRDLVTNVGDKVFFIRIDFRREGQSGLRVIQGLDRFACGVRDTLVRREERIGLQRDGNESVAFRLNGNDVGGLVAVSIFDGLDDTIFNREVGGNRIVDDGFAHRQRVGDDVALADRFLVSRDNAGEHVADDVRRLVEQRDDGRFALARFIFVNTPQADRMATDRETGHREFSFRGDFADFAVVQLPFVGGQAVEVDAQRVAVHIQRIDGVNRVSRLRDGHDRYVGDQRIDGVPDLDGVRGFGFVIGAGQGLQCDGFRDFNGFFRLLHDFLTLHDFVVEVLDGTVVLGRRNLQGIDLTGSGVLHDGGRQFHVK